MMSLEAEPRNDPGMARLPDAVHLDENGWIGAPPAAVFASMTRGTRTRHGTSIRLHRSCDRVGAQQQKVWRTIGQRRLIVIGAFEMRLTITPESGGSRLVAGIDYTLPEPWAGRLLGRVLARPYSRWCLRRICRDAESALEKT